MATITNIASSPGAGAKSALFAGTPTTPMSTYHSIAFDSSYPDGGESLADIFALYSEVLEVNVESSGSYFFDIDKTGQKIIVSDKFAGVSEIQTITLVDGPTGGTWTVTYAGQTTAAVARNVSGANLTTAMDNLSNLVPGDCVVTRAGSGTQASPYIYTFTFGGALAGENVATLTADGTGLTCSTLTIGTTTTGTGVKERQTLTLSAGVADDTFKLTFNAHESAVITIPPGGYVNVTKAQIAAALATISDWSAKTIVTAADGNTNDILVGGTPGTGVFTIDFSKTLTGNVGAITVSSKTGAADGSVAETTQGVTGVSEVQTIEGTDGASAGSMTWTYSGQTTSALAWNVSSAAATTAMEALSNVNVGEVAVVRTGSGTAASPYIWTLTWRADSGNVAQPTATGTGLLGSTATVATSQQGSEIADQASLSTLVAYLEFTGYPA